MSHVTFPHELPMLVDQQGEWTRWSEMDHQGRAQQIRKSSAAGRCLLKPWCLTLFSFFFCATPEVEDEIWLIEILYLRFQKY